MKDAGSVATDRLGHGDGASLSEESCEGLISRQIGRSVVAAEIALSPRRLMDEMAQS